MDLFDQNTERLQPSADNTENCSDNNQINKSILPEYLTNLNTIEGLPPHKLRLGKNGIIMLIRNLSINEGLCNATRLMILELDNTVLPCEILSGDKSGQFVFFTLHNSLLWKGLCLHFQTSSISCNGSFYYDYQQVTRTNFR